MHEIQRLTMVLLDARSNALPPPERPAITNDVNPESQDEYNTNFDFDFNDPSLIAALGDADPSANKANEDKLYQVRSHFVQRWLLDWINPGDQRDKPVLALLATSYKIYPRDR